jgi:hypothetical protein
LFGDTVTETPWVDVRTEIERIHTYTLYFRQALSDNYYRFVMTVHNSVVDYGEVSIRNKWGLSA